MGKILTSQAKGQSLKSVESIYERLLDHDCKVITRSQAKKQSLENDFERLLNHDCKLHIFKYFNLRKLAKLRLVCRSWNEAVCDTLRQKDSLKVFSKQWDITSYIGRQLYDQRQVVSFLRFDKNIDFITLKWWDLEENSSFSLFLSTRMPNITKLMLVVEDDCADYKRTAKILDALPNLETLFFAINYDYRYENYGWEKASKAMQVIENSLQKHTKHLKELFFYMRTRPMTELKLEYIPGGLLDGLTTLHLFDDHPLRLIEPNTTIKELWLKCPRYFEFSSLKAVPNLEILRVSTNRLGDLSHVPNLKLLQTTQSLSLNASDIRKLNTLTKLEQLNCLTIEIVPEDRLVTPVRKQINRTVTHLQLTGKLREYELPDLLKNLLTILGWFGALERLTIYHKLNQKQRESIRARVPKKVAVNFVEYNIDRLMGKFVQPTPGPRVKQTPRKATCVCRCNLYDKDSELETVSNRESNSDSK